MVEAFIGDKMAFVTLLFDMSEVVIQPEPATAIVGVNVPVMVIQFPAVN